MCTILAIPLMTTRIPQVIVRLESFNPGPPCAGPLLDLCHVPDALNLSIPDTGVEEDPVILDMIILL